MDVDVDVGANVKVNIVGREGVAVYVKSGSLTQDQDGNLDYA